MPATRGARQSLLGAAELSGATTPPHQYEPILVDTWPLAMECKFIAHIRFAPLYNIIRSARWLTAVPCDRSQLTKARSVSMGLSNRDIRDAGGGSRAYIIAESPSEDFLCMISRRMFRVSRTSPRKWSWSCDDASVRSQLGSVCVSLRRPNSWQPRPVCFRRDPRSVFTEQLDPSAYPSILGSHHHRN